jgi:hypothetical protein
MGCRVSKDRVHPFCGFQARLCHNHVVCRQSSSFESVRGLCFLCERVLGVLSLKIRTVGDECPVCLTTCTDVTSRSIFIDDVESKDLQDAYLVKMNCGQDHFLCARCFSEPFNVAFRIVTAARTLADFRTNPPLRASLTEYQQILDEHITLLNDTNDCAVLRHMSKCPMCRGHSPWDGRQNHRQLCVMMNRRRNEDGETRARSYEMRTIHVFRNFEPTWEIVDDR